MTAGSQDFFAHKTGYTAKSRCAALQRAGFARVELVPSIGVYEVRALAFKQEPAKTQRALLGLPAGR